MDDTRVREIYEGVCVKIMHASAAAERGMVPPKEFIQLVIAIALDAKAAMERISADAETEAA